MDQPILGAQKFASFWKCEQLHWFERHMKPYLYWWKANFVVTKVYDDEVVKKKIPAQDRKPIPRVFLLRYSLIVVPWYSGTVFSITNRLFVLVKTIAFASVLVHFPQLADGLQWKGLWFDHLTGPCNHAPVPPQPCNGLQSCTLWYHDTHEKDTLPPTQSGFHVSNYRKWQTLPTRRVHVNAPLPWTHIVSTQLQKIRTLFDGIMAVPAWISFNILGFG